jgi:hypothetical protein
MRNGGSARPVLPRRVGPRGHVDEIAKRARNAGITLKSDPHDTEWNSRAFEVSDPSGFLLTVFSDASA